MIAAPSVPNRQASGTSRLGFSTAAEFCAADSIPRNAHSVREILEPIPWPMLKPSGFQAALNTSLLNQIQPAKERNPTGRMTPQTVIDPIRPVMDGPPKLATDERQSRMMSPIHVAIRVEDSQGTKVARYHTAEIAIATLPIASERK